jgi:hypothetical protein
MPAAGSKLLITQSLEATATTNGEAGVTAASGETVVAILTGLLQSGRTYRIWAMANIDTDNAATVMTFRVREDDISGTTIRGGSTLIEALSTASRSYEISREFDAAADGSKTLVVTAQPSTGTFSAFTSNSRYTMTPIN